MVSVDNSGTTYDFSNTSNPMGEEHVKRILSSFVGHPEEFQKVIESSSYVQAVKTKGPAVLVTRSTNPPLAEIVSRMVRLNAFKEKCENELAKFCDVIKPFGLKKIVEFNKEHYGDVKSVKFEGTVDEHSIMVTVKDQFTVDVEAVLSVKKALGKLYGTVFEEDEKWTVIPAFADQVFTLLKAAVGNSFIGKAFKKDFKIKVKSRKDFDTLMNSKDLPAEVREVLKIAVVPYAPSVSYK